MSAPADGTPRVGSVSTFDEEVGLGVVADEEGEYAFHCTEIADGTRTIPVGARVAFAVGPGHRGAWEARRLVRL